MDRELVFLIERNRSSLVSAWQERLGLKPLNANLWMLGTYKFRWVGLDSLPDICWDETTGVVLLPEFFNGKRVRGLVDGEFVEIDDVYCSDSCDFECHDLDSAMAFCESRGWCTHPMFGSCWQTLVRIVRKN